MNTVEENIKKWLEIDNELCELQTQIKELRDSKHELQELISRAIEKKSSDIYGVNISAQNSKLKFIKVKNVKPLTFNYLETCLSEIISNSEQVSSIIEYVKEKREVSYSTEFKKFPNKKSDKEA
jgi:predicted transcriptional regulator